MRWPRQVLLAVSFAAAMAAGAIAQPDFSFMPDGGKETLRGLLQDGVLRMEDVAVRKASEEEWRSAIVAADPLLGEQAIATLASYLAVNMPTEGPAGEVEALPPDGKELAIENCQFCHSFFTGYLVHQRGTEGWRAIFKSPFHMELPMSDAERETFARYSAINMPIPYDDVPEELRF